MPVQVIINGPLSAIDVPLVYSKHVIAYLFTNGESFQSLYGAKLHHMVFHVHYHRSITLITDKRFERIAALGVLVQPLCFLHQIAQLTSHFSCILLQASFKSRIWLYKHSCFLSCLKSLLISHPLVSNQTADDDSSTPANPSCAHHQHPLSLLHRLLYIKLGLFQVLHNVKVRHVIHVYDLQAYAKLSEVHARLHSIHFEHIVDVMGLKLGYA